MTFSPLLYAGLALNIALFLFGMALCVVALWQNRRARPNQYLALTSFGLGLWAVPNGLYYAIAPFDLNPAEIVSLGTSLYALAALCFFFFITELEDPAERRVAFQSRLIAMAWIAIVIGAAWRGYFWTDIRPGESGLYTYALATGGALILLAVAGTVFYIGLRLRDSALAAQEALLWSLVPLPVGLISFGLLGAPVGHVINSAAVLTSIIMVGRVTLHNQLFNPLIELYAQLSLKNTQLEEAGRRKSEFLANMSHELRTPLNSIIGYTELVLQGVYGADLSTQQIDRLQKVHRNGKDLLSLINDVLDLSKIDAGRLDLEPLHIAPARLIDEVISTLQPLLDEKNLSLQRGDQGLPQLYVDEMRVRQAVLNVLANMIKFAREDNTIQLGGFFDAIRNQVVLTIRVSAGSISKSDAHKLSQALHDNERLPAEQFAEFGLGLAVSRRLVEIHGGRIWFDTLNNTFHIGLPAAAELVQSHIQTPEKRPVQGRHPLVLVIDDDVEAIEVIQGYLEPAGYRIYGALSGHEGILRARELAPQLITLDARMPGIDGWGVVDILQTDDQLRHIPVIMVSVTDQSHVMRQADNVIEALVKPLNRHSFLNAVRQGLEAVQAGPPSR